MICMGAVLVEPRDSHRNLHKCQGLRAQQSTVERGSREVRMHEVDEENQKANDGQVFLI